MVDDIKNPKEEYLNFNDPEFPPHIGDDGFLYVWSTSKGEYVTFQKNKADLVNGKVPVEQLPDGYGEGLKFKIVESLPEEGDNKTIYLILNGKGTEGNIYDEYAWIENKWELIGNTSVNLSDYYNKSETDSKFVEKEQGKSLSTNDYTNEDKEKVDNILVDGSGTNFLSDNGEYKEIDVSSFATKGDLDKKQDKGNFATKEELNEKADISSVPTKVSQLSNDSGYLTSIPSEYVTESELNSKGYATVEQLGSKLDSSTYNLDKESFALKSELTNFITSSVDNLINYYKKTETYSKGEIDNKISSITTINFRVVEVLPESGESNLIYLIPNAKQEEQNVKDEYIWIEGKWELIGSTKIDLSNYYNRNEVDSLVNQKLDISVYNLDKATFALKTELSSYLTITNAEEIYSKKSDIQSLATKQELGTKQDSLVSGSNIKTINGQTILGEGNIQISTGISDYSQLSSKPSINSIELSGNKSLSELGIQPAGNYALDSSVPTKVSQLQNDSGFITSSSLPDTSNFVTKVSGKELSTNDYTNEDKAKVDKITTTGSGTKVLADNGQYIVMESGGSGMTVENVSGSTATLSVEGNKEYICGELTSLTINSIADTTDLSIIRFTSGNTATQLSYPEGTPVSGWSVPSSNKVYNIFIWKGALTIEEYDK